MTSSESTEPIEPENQKWHVVRWHNGFVIEGDGTSETARHLYRGPLWIGVLRGMTIEGEKVILDALNKQAKEAADEYPR